MVSVGIRIVMKYSKGRKEVGFFVERGEGGRREVWKGMRSREEGVIVFGEVSLSIGEVGGFYDMMGFE